MSLETLDLRDSPLETERLLGAAAFGDTIDMSGFEEVFAAQNAPIPGFNSLVEPVEASAVPSFNSLIDDADTFQSLV